MHTTNQTQTTSKTEERDAAIQICGNGDNQQEKAMAKGRRKKLPVFKIKAVLIIWLSTKNVNERQFLRVVDEFVARTVANKEDLRALVRSSVSGTLAHLGFRLPAGLEIEIEQSEFLAAKARHYDPFEEPEWVDAVLYPANDTERDRAIRALTYLPDDLQEQLVVYGPDR